MCLATGDYIKKIHPVTRHLYTPPPPAHRSHRAQCISLSRTIFFPLLIRSFRLIRVNFLCATTDQLHAAVTFYGVPSGPLYHEFPENFSPVCVVYFFTGMTNFNSVRFRIKIRGKAPLEYRTRLFFFLFHLNLRTIPSRCRLFLRTRFNSARNNLLQSGIIARANIIVTRG